MAYVILFLSALFLINGIPHFVKGVIGEKHMTPFGKPSNPSLNILWGMINLVAGFYLFNWSLSMTLDRPLADITFIAGVAVTGVFLSIFFGRDAKARGKTN